MSRKIALYLYMHSDMEHGFKFLFFQNEVFAKFLAYRRKNAIGSTYTYKVFDINNSKNFIIECKKWKRKIWNRTIYYYS